MTEDNPVIFNEFDKIDEEILNKNDNILNDEENKDDNILNNDYDDLDNNEENKDDIKEREINELRNTINDVKNQFSNNNTFSRTENKFDFASEVINSLENHKTANLKEEEIDDLIEKRKFTNICHGFGWDVLGNLMGKIVSDVEGYSLSKEGFLVKHTAMDLSKSTTTTMNEQRIKRIKGGKKSKDEIESTY